MELARKALESSTPRRIPLQFPSRNILTFTDGACEGDNFSNITAGASVVVPGVAGRWWFHIVVPEMLAQSWRDSGDKLQLIAETELFPVLICRAMLAVHPVMTLIVHYVDNDGVSDSLVKGTSVVSSLRDMLHDMPFKNCASVWYLGSLELRRLQIQVMVLRELRVPRVMGWTECLTGRLKLELFLLPWLFCCLFKKADSGLGG